MLPDDSDTMSPPPLAPLPETPPPRPSSARIGSLTLTPLHESPADFRTESVRKNFSPLEDEDAAAALDVLGQYEPDETIVVAKPKPKRSSPSKLKERTISIPRTQTLVSIEQVLDAPMDVDTSMPVDASMSMDVQMILDTPMVLGAPIEMEEALPLVESPPPNEPIETLSPKPHFKPLRLVCPTYSLLFRFSTLTRLRDVVRPVRPSESYYTFSYLLRWISILHAT